MKREGAPEALIIDSPGLTSFEQPLDKLLDEAAQADLILWVSSAVRADRELDAHALNAIRAYFAERPNRRRPPMLLILSHVDKLRPLQEWAPPYDLADRENPKSASIRAAMDAAGGDLGFSEDDVIPACLDPKIGVYNVDAIWAAIMELMPEAQRAQLVRTLKDIGPRFRLAAVADAGAECGAHPGAGRAIGRRRCQTAVAFQASLITHGCGQLAICPAFVARELS